MSDIAALPVHIVTGFLGAGKTTFINALLRDPALADALIVVNEFGEIGLDQCLYEKIADDIVLIASGCLCCSLRGDLIDALNGLIMRRDCRALPPFSRIIIETSGLADPAPILHALIADVFLARRLQINGVTTLIDAVNGAATLEAYPEARRQLALADLVIVAKRDLIADAEPLIAKLRAINPAAHIMAKASASDFLAGPFAGPLEKRASAMSAHGFFARAFSFSQDAPIGDSALALFFARLQTLLGPRLLRVKGVLATESWRDRPLVIQGAQHLIHPPQRLAAWPTDDRRSRLVVIVDGIQPAEVESLWRALIGQPEIDRPDLAALVDNPLAPRSGGLLG